MDSATVIDNPHNRLVIATFMAQHYLYAPSWGEERGQKPTFTTEFSYSGLHTHPDLGGAMEGAAQGLSYTSGLILGYHVLVNDKGVIFALAMSMSLLMVRLPPDPMLVRIAARQAEHRAQNLEHPCEPGAGGSDIDLGLEWVKCDPFAREHMRDRMAQAFEYANTLD